MTWLFVTSFFICKNSNIKTHRQHPGNKYYSRQFIILMKIVIDDKIPYIREAMAKITSDTVYINGKDIKATDVSDANALVVRTRTVCGESLLKDSSVRFVATATIGYDHLDTEWLGRAGITWMSCPGCNAGSVAQYLRSVLILLLRRRLVRRGGTVGIVGCGHVGGRVREVARGMGFRVLVCDPPRHDRGESGCGASMEDIAHMSDVITFHVPLTHCGAYPTWHIAGARFFEALRRAPVIINTSRGGVVDEAALLCAMDSGKVSQAVIDTWENEPDVNRRLLDRAFIGTPHIAGYSADGKVNADNMVLAGVCGFFGIADVPHVVPPPLVLDCPLPARGTEDYYLRLYDPLSDSARLKSSPGTFEDLRGNYPLRREQF